MKKAMLLVLMLGLVGCGRNPSGLLGKCVRPIEGLQNFTENFCEEYTFQTSTTKDIKADALAAAKAVCGSGTWTDNDTCSTFGAAGACNYSVAKTAGSESFTLTYKAVYGTAFTAAVTELKSLCEAANKAPLTAVWESIYN